MYSIIFLISLLTSTVFGSYTGEYIIVTTSKTWSDANSYCASQYNTELATFKDDDDVTEMFSLMTSGTSVWIGLNDIDTENTWIFADGYTWYEQYILYIWYNGTMD